MVCSFTDPEKIKEWIELCKLMKEMDTVVHFHFTPDDLSIQMKHTSNRSILDMNFPSTWFSSYEWKETDLYLSTDSLLNIFSRYSGEKIISMESEKHYLLVKCFHDKHNKHFSIPLLYHPQKPVCVESEREIEFKVDASLFYTICKELYCFDKYVFFNLKNEFFQMSAQREGKMMVEVQPAMIHRETPKNYEKTFELYYLMIFLKYSVLYPILNVHLGHLLSFSVEKEYTLHYYVCSLKS
jgi:hypothetical protein